MQLLLDIFQTACLVTLGYMEWRRRQREVRAWNDLGEAIKEQERKQS